MKKYVKKYILNVKAYTPGKPIDEVKRQLGVKDVIKLASNESPYGPSKKVREAIARASKEINRYPDSHCYYLRNTLARLLKVNTSQLIFSNGSDEIIVLAARAFIKPKDEVIIAQPSFLIYNIASKLEGATIKAIPLKNFRYDLAAMKKAVTKKTKIIFLGNPDNPSGKYFTQKEMSQFLKGLPKNILVFLDEAYYEYVDQKDYVDSLKLLKTYKNIIVTRTFSKMYGLAGLRIGYGISSAEMIDVLNRMREPFNVNSIAQAAALACLKDKAYYKKIAKEVSKQRQTLYQDIKKIGLDYVESYTNFVLINVKRDATKVFNALMKKGVIVRDMSTWGMKNYIRTSIGALSENKKLIKSLKEIL